MRILFTNTFLRVLRFGQRQVWRLKDCLFSSATTRVLASPFDSKVVRHALDRFPSTYHLNPTRSFQCIFDLSYSTYRSWMKPVTIRVLSYPFGKTARGCHRSIEGWSTVGGRSQAQNRIFRSAQCGQIATTQKQGKPETTLDGNRLILAHYNTQFGHFVAEILGQLIYYAGYPRQVPELRDFKLVVLAPSPGWEELIAKLTPAAEVLEFLDPRQFVEHNVVFHNSIVCRRLSPWQNLTIARNVICNYLETRTSRTGVGLQPGCPARKVFLNRGVDASRIVNFGTVEDFLTNQGYMSLNPLHFSPEETLYILRNAEEIVSEQGSVFLNLVLCRHKKTIVLSGSRDGCVCQDYFPGGGIFNEMLRGVVYEVFCPPEDSGKSKIHPYSQPVVVVLEDLKKAIEHVFP